MIKKDKKEIIFNKIYFLKNFETWKNFTFSENKITLDTLKSYNENGYNIYQTVNTFIGKKRQIKDLAEIKSCFVDIDYAEIVSNSLSEKERATYLKNKFVLEVKPTLEQIKTVYWLSPNQINVTYKWFHILFHYEKYCYFIDTDLHIKINDKLNNLLWGDPNARDLARVYKSVWYIDHKSNRSCKIIELKNTGWCVNKESVITKEIIEERFEEEYSERNIWKVENKKNSSEKREFVKNENINKMNSIDALVFIENIKEFLKVYKITFEKEKTKDELEQIKSQILNKLKYEKISETTYKLFESDWLSLTSWLTIDLDSDWIWKINDYSQKNRRWNFNFLKNWIFKDMNFDYNSFSKITNKTAWLSLNSNLEKKSIIDNKAAWDAIYKRWKVFDKDLEKLIERNYKIYEEITETPGFYKIYFSLFSHIKEQIHNPNSIKSTNWELEISLGEFAENYFWWNAISYKNNRSYLLYLIDLISQIRLPFIEKLKLTNWLEKEALDFKKIISVKYWLETWRWNFKKIYVKPFWNNDSFILSPNPFYFNKNILKYTSWLVDTKISDLFLKINCYLENTKSSVYKEDLKTIYLFLDYKNTNLRQRKSNLKNHFEKAIKLWFFQNYEFKDWYLFVYKTKFLS